jgi:hypothetical protein
MQSLGTRKHESLRRVLRQFPGFLWAEAGYVHRACRSVMQDFACEVDVNFSDVSNAWILVRLAFNEDVKRGRLLGSHDDFAGPALTSLDLGNRDRPGLDLLR